MGKSNRDGNLVGKHKKSEPMRLQIVMRVAYLRREEYLNLRKPVPANHRHYSKSHHSPERD